MVTFILVPFLALAFAVGCYFISIGLNKDRTEHEAVLGTGMPWWMSTVDLVTRIGGKKGLQSFYILTGLLIIIGIISIAVDALTY